MTVTDHAFPSTARAVHDESTVLRLLDFDILFTNLAKDYSVAFDYPHTMLHFNPLSCKESDESESDCYGENAHGH